MLLQPLETAVPKPLVLCDPVPHRGESFGHEVVAAFAAVPPLRQETGFEQDAEVLRDRGTAHFEMGCDVADRALGFGEQIQHLAARTMADRGEHIGLGVGSRHHAV